MSANELKHAGINLGHADPLLHERAGAEVFGFWVFLMSDAVIFALLFATYGVMLPRTAGGPTPHEVYEIKSAFTETLVLLLSSFTYGMASLAMKYEHRQHRLQQWLVVTLALGLAFIAMEIHDFWKMFGENATPQRSGFLSSFYALVPTHMLHVTTGCIWIVVLLAQLRRFGIDARNKLNVLRLGLFWHFLDIVWVAIFSVVYLQGLAK
ncbi:cytochrome (ubi)quinol oxidase subunit III [Novosphingobium malaysiense]|uniref:Cytochrome bo(3) ubiquinol oxidase subunit 3 n=1 Tax=Novosphingobium malaysiense TaxID=1348853 RepID=A0A0B1ZIG1_9SPHN|nr:cytochrome (ubi)quinol oxidase subunit III [Novosphingobium malaysiense]KHK90900.1 cytochrome o ubiquinol oxidase subunit III [Novosphingobium malaysiense]